MGSFDLCTSDLKIRPGDRSDWRVLRMLLPEVVHLGARVKTWVAIDTANDVIIGAIAADPTFRHEPVVGVKIALHVVAPWRGRGVEKALVEGVIPAVRRWGGQALYTWGAIEVGSEVEQFWLQLGFVHGERTTEGRITVQSGLDLIEPIWAQLCKRGRVPEGLNVLNLDEVDPTAIARLYQKHIGGSYDEILGQITGDSARRFNAYASPVLQLDGQLVGVILGRTMEEAGLGFVEAIIVDTPFRGTWANIALRLYGWRRCVEIGVHTLTYFTHKKHTDTIRFCDKLGVTTRVFVEPYRILDAASVTCGTE